MIEAADGKVVVQGRSPESYEKGIGKRLLTARLQARGIAAAPLNTAEEAARDPDLPPAIRRHRAERVRGRDGRFVLDLTHYVAGPYATFLLAEGGYEILKVERPEIGDPLREGAPDSFAALNVRKRRITLDFSSETGRQLVTELAQKACLVIEGLRGGAFRRAFPALGIPVLSLPALAARGPYRTFRGFASTVHAFLGFTYCAGAAPIPWADFIAGARAASCALDMLRTGSPDTVLPQSSCMRSVPVADGFRWPSRPSAEPDVAEAPLGEHNDEVYGYLGLSVDEINRLYVDGVL